MQEVFYGDGEHHWSSLAQWDLLTGALMGAHNIVERFVKVPSLDAKLSFDELGVPQERPRCLLGSAVWQVLCGGGRGGGERGVGGWVGGWGCGDSTRRARMMTSCSQEATAGLTKVRN